MKLKLLIGAPLREHLDFDNEVLYKPAECHASDVTPEHGKSFEEPAALRWREIRSKHALLRTGWSQPFLPGPSRQGAHESHSFAIPGIEEPSQMPAHNASNLDTALALEEEALAVDDYLQHSLIFHDTLLSSQVVQDLAGMNDTVTSSSFLTTSLSTTQSDLSYLSCAGSIAPVLQVPSTTNVSPLGSLPSAQYLRAIYPQTPTPNLLCALMTIPERREVLVRKGGYRMDLWEIAVGDDTCSRFKVTFWSRPPGNSSNEGQQNVQLLEVLQRLQVGDLVLLRNIALTSFRDIVHGQSLNAAMSRARTSIDVLMKSSGMHVAQIGDLPASVLETFMRVKRWARSHVAGDTGITRKRKGDAVRPDQAAKRLLVSSTSDEDLPSDTMELR